MGLASPDRWPTGRERLWEIHPVYAIDVCEKTTLAACKVNDESVWLPLEEWLNEHEEDDQ